MTPRRFLTSLIIYLSLGSSASAIAQDTMPSGFSQIPSWRLGTEISPSWVPQTNSFLKGNNDDSKKISSALSGDLRADFSFAPDTKEGMLYKGLYQGIGAGVNSFFSNSLLGTPVSAYVYQGAPIAHITDRLWLGYEWKFGAAFGWKHYDEDNADNNTAVSTAVTAMLGAGIKLHYSLSSRWKLSAGISAVHYSNGNTSWPNGGVNALGATVGIAYILNPQKDATIAPAWLAEKADHNHWLFDIMTFGAWRKRVVIVGEEPQLCPGKFGIVGIQFSPLRTLNRYVAVGPAIEAQWDESAGLKPYWIEGTSGSNIKFERPPFAKQLSVGISAHAELTMPIFSVNAGIGYDIIDPKGDKRFYQSLTLKTFLTKNIFLNVGYRLGDFKDPQNLMLGVGVRL